MVHISAGCEESFPPILADILADRPSTSTEGNVWRYASRRLYFFAKKKIIATTRGILWTALQAAV